MKITFLGTGTSQGIPVIACNCPVCRSLDYRDKRLRTALHIETPSTSLIIDIGPDFRQQVLRQGIARLDAILLTHEHKDHTAGLDEVRSFNFRQNKDMPVYGRPAVLEQLRSEFRYIFDGPDYPGLPRVQLHPIENRPFRINELTIEPVEVLHYKLPVYGFRIGKFAYITDAKTISEQEKAKLQNLDVLVLNALQRKPHISHLTLDEALALSAELRPGFTWLTHLSHTMGPARDIDPLLPVNTGLAYDGLQIVVD